MTLFNRFPLWYCYCIIIVTLTYCGSGIRVLAQDRHNVADTSGKKNKLQFEESPYLLQHADNPINWHPWGDEAFRKSENQNKPVFLSIGYSTCYWCHVMERNVFMDEEIATFMNEHFINIKVDREERPDIDRVYMAAVQALTGGGGWPMSVFLTPQLKPFFGATYIPPNGTENRPGFKTLAENIIKVWNNQPQQIVKQAEKVTNHIRVTNATSLEPEPVSGGIADSAFKTYQMRYDKQNGGFGKAPKFPRPSSLLFLLNYYRVNNNSQALNMTEHTLLQMAEGGINDHIGGGFHRYSTDAQWHVPHFEKMLYDQALLTTAYLKAYEITGNQRFAKIARSILNFVDREMTHPKGGFYSALNAESPPPKNPNGEEEEGAFYLWTYDEIQKQLPPKQSDLFTYIYGVKPDGNVKQDPHNVFIGENILHKIHSINDASARFNMDQQTIEQQLSEAEATLFSIRQKRPKPFLDDKILLSWNSLMISAYADAYRVLEDPTYKTKAIQSIEFLMDTLYNSDTGETKRRYRNGEARFNANLADYAYFVRSLIDLFEATQNSHWLNLAVQFTESQIDLFYDQKNGAFFDNRTAGTELLMQTKEFYDGDKPAGNSMAINNLAALAEITKNDRFKKLAGQSIRYFGSLLNDQPSAVPHMLLALPELKEE